MSDQSNRPNPVVRRSESPASFEFRHPLNPNSQQHMTPLSRLSGMERVGVTLIAVPPGKESFVYHSHQHEEEFVYILAGRAVVEVDGTDHELAPGDFVGFPTPSVPHQVRNPFAEELRYLSGGENRPVEIADFPRLEKRLIRNGSELSIVANSDLKPWGKE